jgi:hypothetical protein
MRRRNLILVIILFFGLSGCSSKLGNNPIDSESLSQPPKFEVAADMQNDPVNGVTPEILGALIQSYISVPEQGISRKNFIRVINSIQVQGGTDFLVRVKDGFCLFFMDNQSKKITYTSGSSSADESHTVICYGFSPIKRDSQEMVLTAHFNCANAKKVTITWSDGTTATYELTNGTLMLAPFDINITIKKYEIKDKSGNTLFRDTMPDSGVRYK